MPNPPPGESWEYSVVISIRNEKGEEITRHVVGVGALQPSERRTFSLAVEVFGAGARLSPAEKDAKRSTVPAGQAPSLRSGQYVADAVTNTLRPASTK